MAFTSSATTSLSGWDFHKYRVQQEVRGGQFINAESTLVVAGPPDITGATAGEASDWAYPVGLLETFGLQQSRQLQRIFEIGSSRSYFVPGRTIGSITLGRTFYYGPSLMKVLYAYYAGTTNGDGTVHTALTGATASTMADLGIPSTLYRNPGFDMLNSGSKVENSLYIDLASDLFAQPTGMGVVFKDAQTQTVGGMYFNECYVQGHQMTVSSGSVLIMEGASIQYDLLVPVKFSPGAGKGATVG